MSTEPTPAPTKAELEAMHGTPIQFARACYRAIGEISVDEAQAAIAKYEREWSAAK